MRRHTRAVAVTFLSWQFQLSSASCSSPRYVSPVFSSTCERDADSETLARCTTTELWEMGWQPHREDVPLCFVHQLDRDANTLRAGHFCASAASKAAACRAKHQLHRACHLLAVERCGTIAASKERDRIDGQEGQCNG